ncbi:MAG: hypothetical protein JST95_01695 [Bacteroidetes bacterium]|nr:hypothetical protein [Bacteroidota bacterium]
MIKLSEKWAKLLVSKPETGMGYQVVSIILKNGMRYDQVVINSGYITHMRNYDNIPFEENDIEQIIVTHEKWKW